MNYIIFVALSIIGYIITIIITNQIGVLKKEYIGIKYSSFEFSNNEKKPYGLNILIRMLFPACYIVICSGIFYETKNMKLVENIFLVSIFYYLVRWIYLIFILQRKELQNWKSEFIISIIGSVISWGVYEIFITKTTQIFVSIEELRDGIWIAIITFVFVLLREYIYKNAYIDNDKENKRKEIYILKKYEYFKNKYGKLIATDNKEITNLIYAIMIFENFNRPAFIRIFENFKCLFGIQATLGIMQVKTNTIISNKQSIELGCKIIEEKYEINKSKNFEELYRCDVIDQTIFDYNPSYEYVDEVRSIYDVICNNIDENGSLTQTGDGKKFLKENYIDKIKNSKFFYFIINNLKIILVAAVTLLIINYFKDKIFNFIKFWFTNEDGIEKELIQDAIMITLTFITIFIAVFEIIKAKKEQIKQNKLNIELQKHNLIVDNIKAEMDSLLPGNIMDKMKMFYYDSEKAEIELGSEKVKTSIHIEKMMFNIVYEDDKNLFSKICKPSVNELILYTDGILTEITTELIKYRGAKRNGNTELMREQTEKISQIIQKYIKESSGYYNNATENLKKYIYESEQKILEKYR